MELQTPFLTWDSFKKNILQKKKNLYFVFVELEKAFDWVPRDIVWWGFRSGWLSLYIRFTGMLEVVLESVGLPEMISWSR